MSKILYFIIPTTNAYLTTYTCAGERSIRIDSDYDGFEALMNEVVRLRPQTNREGAMAVD
jgi:hypothetical protein